MSFIRKNWGNIVFIGVLAILIIPQTRTPVQVFVQRLLSFSPSEISEEKRMTLENYNWELKSSKGMIENMANSEGEVVIINFWATWCPPCVAEMPSLQKLYDAYGAMTDFYLVTNETPEVVSKFLTKNGYTFPVYYYSQLPSEILEVQGLPTTFVIDKKGTIVMREVGAADWDSQSVHILLDSLLEE